MTEHSVDELKRQMQQAASRLYAANNAYIEAKRRFHEALAMQTGWIGKVATRGARSILVRDVKFGITHQPFKVTGFKLNKDGRPGRVEVSFIVDGDPIEFTDYVPPANGNGK